MEVRLRKHGAAHGLRDGQARKGWEKYVNDRPSRLSFPARWSWCLIALTLATAACAAGPPASKPEPGLDRLLFERRYFDLRRFLTASGNLSRLEALYVRGRVANAFNLVTASVDDLTAYLREAGAGEPKGRIVAALGTLADNYIRLCQYAKVAEIRRTMEPLLTGEVRPDYFADFQASTALWEALDGVPPQSVTGLEETELEPFAGAGAGVPVVIGGRTVPLIPDTGSSLSLISHTEAGRLGLRVLNVSIEINTATGKSVPARAAVADELRIGRVVVRNVVFLVVEQELLYFAGIMEQRTGLLGFPVLADLKEVTFLKNGGMRVPARPRLSGAPNFFLERENPVLETSFEGRRLLFHLDTGALRSQLYPSFFRAYRDRIVARGVPTGENIESVGESVTVPAYLIQGVHFRIAGRNVLFDRPLPVLTKATGSSSEVFDGVLGIDLLTHSRTMTISYDAMRIVLE